MFQGPWIELKSKKGFQRDSVTKYLRLTVVTRVKYRNTGKFQFLFFRSFLLVLTKFLDSQKDWALGYHSSTFRHFLNIS